MYFSGGPEPLVDVAVLTDHDGSFKLSAPVPGTYTIECFADGFERATLTVGVNGSPAEDVKFRLKPAN